MASGIPRISSSSSIPFYRDTRIIAVLVQIVFAIAVMAGCWVLYQNMIAGLARANLLPTFDFLNVPASFPIAESVIPYDPSMSYWQAFVVGLLNTARVALIGIVLATILGIILGIFRLSSNWLLSNVAMAYVEIIRNVPLLLQLIFWFYLTKMFPRVQESIAIGDAIFLHNRGVTLAWPEPTASFASWLWWLVGALLVAVAIYTVRQIQFRRRDRPGVAIPYAILGWMVIAGVGYVLTTVITGTAPAVLVFPELQRFNFIGGATVTASFAALVVGLVIYTAVYIGEIVRSGILAVSKGQREAARALGLTQGQTLRLVIFPQALRIMIPPMTSQYLNLTKNSSLAVAIAYPDLFYIANTINNQTGQAVPVIVMLMVSYLSASLFTSLLMNWYNRRIQLVER